MADLLLYLLTMYLYRFRSLYIHSRPTHNAWNQGSPKLATLFFSDTGRVAGSTSCMQFIRWMKPLPPFRAWLACGLSMYIQKQKLLQPTLLLALKFFFSHLPMTLRCICIIIIPPKEGESHVFLKKRRRKENPFSIDFPFWAENSVPRHTYLRKILIASFRYRE